VVVDQPPEGKDPVFDSLVVEIESTLPVPIARRDDARERIVLLVVFNLVQRFRWQELNRPLILVRKRTPEGLSEFFVLFIVTLTRNSSLRRSTERQWRPQGIVHRRLRSLRCRLRRRYLRAHPTRELYAAVHLHRAFDVNIEPVVEQLVAEIPLETDIGNDSLSGVRIASGRLSPIGLPFGLQSCAS